MLAGRDRMSSRSGNGVNEGVNLGKSEDMRVCKERIEKVQQDLQVTFRLQVPLVSLYMESTL